MEPIHRHRGVDSSEEKKCRALSWYLVLYIEMVLLLLLRFLVNNNNNNKLIIFKEGRWMMA
jgi:hypothetical protein